MLHLTTTDLLELRYDGPIPSWERPANPAVLLRQRMRLFRRMARDYAREAVRRSQCAIEVDDEHLSQRHRDGAARARRDLAQARRTHSALAAELGRLIRLRAL